MMAAFPVIFLRPVSLSLFPAQRIDERADFAQAVIHLGFRSRDFFRRRPALEPVFECRYRNPKEFEQTARFIAWHLRLHSNRSSQARQYSTPAIFAGARSHSLP